MKTKVFEYNGYVGIESDVKADGLVNNPLDAGQLGFVVDTTHVEFSKSAIAILKQIPKSNDSLGDVDIFKTADGRVIFCWLGGPKTILHLDYEISGSRDYNPDLFPEGSDDILPSQDFMDFVDGIGLIIKDNE